MNVNGLAVVKGITDYLRIEDASMDTTMEIIYEIINQCLGTKTKFNIKNVLKSINNIAPCASIIFLQFKAEHNQIESMQILASEGCQKKWLDNYQKNNFAMIDPIVLGTMREQHAVEWSEAIKTQHNCSNQFRSYASRFGLTRGVAYAYPFSQNSSPRHLLSLQVKQKQEHDIKLYKFALECLLPHIHSAIEKYPEAGKTPGKFILSSREREVLWWVGQGKKSKEIGKILAISENTVKYHLRNVFIKLDVTNRVHAITKAISYHLIDE